MVDRGAGVVLAGDLVTLPAPFLDTACPTGWRKALAEVSTVRFRILVPGHGAPMSPAQFHRYRDAFDHFIACAATTADKAQCSAGWASDLGDLLPPAEQRRAAAMTAYYVDMLRANGGKAKDCAV